MNKQGPKGIDWLRDGYTWSPFSGCWHGCSYCWARRTYDRFHLDFNPAFHPEKLNEPLKVKKPARIGVCFSGDMWGDWYKNEPDKRAEQNTQIEQVLSVCRQAPQHRFLFLTKNPARYSEFSIPPNCWCGTSTTGAETESEMHRITDLLNSAPMDRIFISLEPWTGGDSVLAPEPYDEEMLSWVIIGGLTGKGAKKPPKKDVDTLVTALHSAGIPVFVKSNAGVGPQEYPEGLRLD